MKALSLLLLSLSRVAMATTATYEVPVHPDLKEYATFELEDFKKKIDDNSITIKYTLPDMLAGSYERIKLEGRAIPGTNELELTGDKGQGRCTMGTQFTCTISYDKIDIDEAKAIEAIKAVSKDDEEVEARIKVMRAFSTDPVGIVTY